VTDGSDAPCITAPPTKTIANRRIQQLDAGSSGRAWQACRSPIAADGTPGSSECELASTARRARSEGPRGRRYPTWVRRQAHTRLRSTTQATQNKRERSRRESVYLSSRPGSYTAVETPASRSAFTQR
jgi:glycine/D-amino acid oxidase-like deaminating enzyme